MLQFLIFKLSCHNLLVQLLASDNFQHSLAQAKLGSSTLQTHTYALHNGSILINSSLQLKNVW
jgi:hypothetical protein